MSGQSEAERLDVAGVILRDGYERLVQLPLSLEDLKNLARQHRALQAQVEHLEKRQAVYHDWAWEVLDNLSAEDAKKWSGNLGRALEPHEDPNV